METFGTMPTKAVAKKFGFCTFIEYKGTPLEFFTLFGEGTRRAEALSKAAPGAYISVMSVETGLEICAWLDGRYIPNN